MRVPLLRIPATFGGNSALSAGPNRLDRRILARLGVPDGDILRQPLAQGNSSFAVNRIDVRCDGRDVATLAEKIVAADSNEARFWRAAEVRRPSLESECYASAQPADIIDNGASVALYLPYVPALDRDLKGRRRAFRTHIHAITAAVADLNGRNLVTTEAPAPVPFPPARPTLKELQLRLNLNRSAAIALRDLWRRAHDRWETVQDSYQALPTCLNHHDVSPGNAVHVDGRTIFTDFGLAAPGPIGADLHTVIRWSGQAAHDADHVAAVIATYHERVQRYVPGVTTTQLRLAAHATYFLRYTNLKFKSARYMHAFGLALGRMLAL
jgi:hypothetical protein